MRVSSVGLFDMQQMRPFLWPRKRILEISPEIPFHPAVTAATQWTTHGELSTHTPACSKLLGFHSLAMDVPPFRKNKSTSRLQKADWSRQSCATLRCCLFFPFLLLSAISLVHQDGMDFVERT
jgi:hypothetical protein